MVSKIQYLAFTTKHKGRANRIVTDIVVFPAFDPRNQSVPQNAGFKTKALWDTGATGSVLVGETARSMNLVPTGQVVINHAGGRSECNTFLVNISLPNNVMVVGITATEAKDTVDNFGAIIGMDVITQGDFAITNVNGETHMSFRVPSMARIDYVRDAFKNVGRNAKCPCGSGKKFKDCHAPII